MASSGKKPKVSDHGSRSQKSYSRFGKYEKLHNGVCKAWSFCCFKCGRTGHMSRDCIVATTTTSSYLICFQCNRRGHKRSQCLTLASVGPAVALTPTTLRITDSRQGRAEAPVAKSRAFQLTAEEARAAPGVVMRIYLLHYLFIILITSHVCVFVYWIVHSERHISYGII